MTSAFVVDPVIGNRTGLWKRALRVHGAQHGSFTALQALFPQLAGRPKDFEAGHLIGTIPGPAGPNAPE